MDQLWGGKRVPVTLIGGVLGAGKTTLLNRLLAEADGRRLVVLVNDVGDIAVDAALIASATDDVIELTNGCICCSMTDGLGAALEELRQLGDPPDQIIVELSGVAEPARVAPWASTSGFRLEAIVVCVDAERIDRQVTDRWLSDTVKAQLRAADLIVLTKTDLVDAQPRLDSYTSATVVDAKELPLDTLLAFHRGADTSIDPGAAVAAAWVVSSVLLPAPIEPEHVRTQLARLPRHIIRLKGFVGDHTGGCWLVQGVGERRSLSPVSSEIAGDPRHWGIVAIATPAMTLTDLDAALEALRGPL